MILKQLGNNGFAQASDALDGTALTDAELEGIAGGKLDPDIIAEWKEEVAYARFRLSMPIEEVLALLANTEYDFSPEDFQELESIARDVYSLSDIYGLK